MLQAATTAIGHVTDGYEDLPSMQEPGCRAFVGDVFAHLGGSELCSGFFELFASQPLDDTYNDDETTVVVEGEFVMTDLDTGQVVRAKAKDALFFPKGAHIRFETPDRALGFYTGRRVTA